MSDIQLERAQTNNGNQRVRIADRLRSIKPIGEAAIILVGTVVLDCVTNLDSAEKGALTGVGLLLAGAVALGESTFGGPIDTV